MAAKTAKVSNVSLDVTERDIKEFFSFSGDIEYVELRSADEWSQVAYVTFKDTQGAETAVLLSGATIGELSVIIQLDQDYQLPAGALAPHALIDARPVGTATGSPAQKAEDVVTTVLAKSFIFGKDAISKAKAFDDKIQFTSTATSKVASIDRKIGLSEKVNVGASVVNDKVKEIDEKFQISGKTKSAFSAAEQTIGGASSAILNNRYVSTGASWFSGAFNKVATAATDVGSRTKAKVVAEEERRGFPYQG